MWMFSNESDIVTAQVGLYANTQCQACALVTVVVSTDTILIWQIGPAPQKTCWYDMSLTLLA